MSRARGQGVLSVERDDDPFGSIIESLFPVSQAAGFDFSALAADGHQTALPGLQDAVLKSLQPGLVAEATSTSVSADITVQPLEAGALTFALHNVGGVTPGSQAEAGFQRAAALWQSFLGDPVTVRLDVGFSSLGPGILGSTGSTSHVVSYSAVRTALAADSLSAEDAAAVASLSAGSSLAFFTNNAAGTRVFDNDGSVNNTYLNVNTADLKALGITTDANGQPVDTGVADGSITFSSDFTWDFDPSNGIAAGAIDFVGVAFHEIGHALGFVSGVDLNDIYTGAGPGGQTNLNPYAIYSVLDLFRYSSTDGVAVRDLSFGGSSYFSVSGGLANLALFSTGRFQGDGRQASHWKDNLGIGIMDPTSVPAGQANVITSRDIQALDVIGWNLVTNSGAGVVSINDMQISEGDSGFKTGTFTVTRNGGVATPFDVFFRSSDGSATVADSDYLPTIGVLHFDANVKTQTISVIIRSDTKVESDETFFINLAGASNGAIISDDVGIGTIINDDSAVSINDVTISEGNSGVKLATFTVTRNGGTAAFDVNFTTADNSATVADSDYVAKAGTLHFDTGVNTQTISVTINGDTKVESDDAFFVNLSSATNGATIIDGQGTGTITNDDPAFAQATFQLSAFAHGDGWSSNNTYPRKLADVDGDHMADIVGFGENGVVVALATGGGAFGTPSLQLGNFARDAGGWTSDDIYPRQLADVDGDHMADIVGFGENGVVVALATGGGSFGTAMLKVPTFAHGAGGWTSNDAYPRELADVNGDGMADIVGFGETGVWVALASGGGSFETPSLQLANFARGVGGWTSENTYPRHLADVNGDHMADIVGFGEGGVWVALATGGGSFGTPSLKLGTFAHGAGGWISGDAYPREAADVNGDGMADIVGFGEAGVWVAFATGGGSFGTPSLQLGNFAHNAGGWTSENTYPRQLADVDGDHAADIVGFGSNGVWDSLSNGFHLI
jgi:hypothetical protein